ncbi:MAG: helix-turn-helix domain-containing protein, partial [Cyanobacteria bacterium P01_G01_bin.49]
MSRKQPFNSSHRKSHHSTKSESSFAVDKIEWRRLLAKLATNGSRKDHESDKHEILPPQKPPKKPNYIKLLIRLLAKLPRGQKPSFDPRQTQREILENIGQELYEVRQKQQLSLKKVSTETRIPIGLLASIEKGKIEDLPEAIYTKGLIKQFANFVGLNGKKLADSYPDDMKLSFSKSSRFPIGIPILQFRSIHFYFIYIVIIIVSVQSISNTLKRAALEETVKEFSNPSQVKSETASPVTKPITVKLYTKGKSQIAVIVDGKTEFEGIMPKETQKIWEAHQYLTIQASDSGQVLVTFNNQKPELFGKIG